jgi:pimeloyl-ACP methyl ester carboxylesterase
LAAKPFEWLRLGLELLPVQADVVIAHSFGSNSLLEYLQCRSEYRMRAAVLMSPFYKPRHEDFEWSVLTYYVDQFQRLLEEGLTLRQKRRLSRDFVSAMAEKVRDRVGPHGWMQFFDLFSRTPSLQLSSLQMPCLVLGGENDFSALPDDGRALARALPLGEAAILPDCGHFSMAERPETVAAVINDFLGRAIPRS